MVIDVRDGEAGMLLVNKVKSTGRVVFAFVAPLRDAEGE